MPLISSSESFEVLSNRFGLIKDIDLNSNDSWKRKIFLTLDMDWCEDEIIEDTINLLGATKATWFVTHSSGLLPKMAANKSFELGIHPNFNPSIMGQNDVVESGVEILESLLKILPGAKSVRGHSITSNSWLSGKYWEYGLTHESNTYIPFHSGIKLAPFQHWTGLISVPYFWEDDLDCNKITEYFAHSSVFAKHLQIYDFHPIHIFLNTECLHRYERTRPLHRHPSRLKRYRYKGYGTRNFFLDLLSSAGTFSN